MAITDRPTETTTGRLPTWRDTREWIDRARAIGELRDVHGVDWEQGIGEVTEMLDHAEGSPSVLFDDIPGYPSGRRVIVNCSGTPGRQAVTLNLPQSEATHDGLFRFWRSVLEGFQPVDPVDVEIGPVFENVVEGDDVDLEAFPVPLWHPHDGGRFIGTASMNILKDPDSDWVNIGTYRNQIFARDEMGIYISPGKHGRLIRDKYLARGERIPVVVVVGADPLLFMASCAEGIPYGMSELAWAGAVRGEPIEVVRGRHTGLPFPATAEIAIEGWIDPTAPLHDEGPYGEWMGYYASGEGQTHVIKVAAIYHRNDPILLGCPQGKPPHEDNRFLAYLKSALIEQQLRAAGVPKVTGVWCPPEAGNRMMTVIAVDQSYPGHATQALLVGSQTGTSAYAGRVAVVVDPDIDITSLDDVMWAIMTRCDPVRDVRIIDRAWSGPLDPAIHPDHRGMNSRLLIDATKPWEWRERFAEPVVTAEMSRAARQRWGWILDPAGTPPATDQGRS
ncbi:MAG TPA: UbiD family decarboxylase [Candidatus Saccharimonadales bacterium]|nr:UbiD family decarboxylase [Candidatus Saccharimonadales bacterium]